MKKMINPTPPGEERPGTAADGRGRRRGRTAFAAAAATLLTLSAAHPPVRAGSAPKTTIPPAGIPTGVDGVLFAEPGGGKNVWALGHHAYKAPTGPKISCHDADTGTPCPNKNSDKKWPMTLNTRALALDTTTPGDISTTQVPQVVTDASTKRAYYPAVTLTALPGFPGGSVGVGCVDLQAQYNCPYTPLAPLTNAPGASNVNGLTGFVRVSNRLYGTATDGRELCFHLPSQAACDGQPYAGDTPPSNDAAGLGPQDFYGVKIALGDRIYTTSNTPSRRRTTAFHLPTLTCFDASLDRPCADFTPKILSVGAGTYLATAIFPADGSGAGKGVCVVLGKRTAEAPSVLCFDTSGRSVAPGPGLSTLFPSGGADSVIFPPLTTAYGGGLRTYFPYYTQDGRYPGNTICYSWTRQAPCAQFPNPAGHPEVNGGHTRDYGYLAVTGCVLGHGDRGFLFGMDPATGAGGCGS